MHCKRKSIIGKGVSLEPRDCRKQFIIDTRIPNLKYEPIMDKHLEYYFASRNNRRNLIRTKLINNRNEIIDHELKKVVMHSHQPIVNSFRIRRKSTKKMSQTALNTGKILPNKTLSKKQFRDYLQGEKQKIESRASNEPRQAMQSAMDSLQ